MNILYVFVHDTESRNCAVVSDGGNNFQDKIKI